MSDKFEKTFEFAVPLERVWQAFTDPKELDAWYPGSIKDADVRPGGRITWLMGEYDYTWEIVEVEPHRRWCGRSRRGCCRARPRSRSSSRRPTPAAGSG